MIFSEQRDLNKQTNKQPSKEAEFFKKVERHFDIDQLPTPPPKEVPEGEKKVYLLVLFSLLQHPFSSSLLLFSSLFSSLSFSSLLLCLFSSLSLSFFNIPSLPFLSSLPFSSLLLCLSLLLFSLHLLCLSFHFTSLLLQKSFITTLHARSTTTTTML